MGPKTSGAVDSARALARHAWTAGALERSSCDGATTRGIICLECPRKQAALFVDSLSPFVQRALTRHIFVTSRLSSLLFNATIIFDAA